MRLPGTLKAIAGNGQRNLGRGGFLVEEGQQLLQRGNMSLQQALGSTEALATREDERRGGWLTRQSSVSESIFRRAFCIIG